MCSVKQTQDDEKSVERAHRELVKLDQQLGVSMAQFTEVSIHVLVSFSSNWGGGGDIKILINDDIILSMKRFVTITSMHLRSSNQSRPRPVILSTHSRQAF